MPTFNIERLLDADYLSRKDEKELINILASSGNKVYYKKESSYFRSYNIEKTTSINCFHEKAYIHSSNKHYMKRNLYKKIILGLTIENMSFKSCDFSNFVDRIKNLESKLNINFIEDRQRFDQYSFRIKVKDAEYIMSVSKENAESVSIRDLFKSYKEVVNGS